MKIKEALDDILKDKERTVQQATVEDVKKRAKSETSRLQQEISSLKSRLETAEAELVFWMSIPRS